MKLKYTFLLIFAMSLASCEKVFFEKEPANDPTGNFESLWQTFNEKYAVFNQRGVDWNALYNTYRPLVNNNTSDDQLFTTITDMLSHLDDGHVSLMAAGRPFWSGFREFRERTKDKLFSFEVIRDNYIKSGFTSVNGRYAYGKLDNDIGYLFVANLSGEKPGFTEAFIQANQSSKGIIIDLRHNAGGDFTNGEVIAQHFAGKRTLAFSATPKNGPRANDFGATINYYLEPKGTQFTKPVIVLIDNYTISAGESLVLYLKELPQVTLVGEHTTGAMGERVEKEMPNGWIYSITGQIITAADGKIYEGPGIPPDVTMVNTEADVSNGVDKTLEKAMEMIGQ